MANGPKPCWKRGLAAFKDSCRALKQRNKKPYFLKHRFSHMFDPGAGCSETSLALWSGHWKSTLWQQGLTEWTSRRLGWFNPILEADKRWFYDINLLNNTSRKFNASKQFNICPLQSRSKVFHLRTKSLASRSKLWSNLSNCLTQLAGVKKEHVGRLKTNFPLVDQKSLVKALCPGCEAPTTLGNASTRTTSGRKR